MKKALLTLCLLLAMPGARAQHPERNILGVRAGVEIASLRARGEYVHGTSNPRTGFRLGVSDQVRLHRRLPFYIETGADFSSRGGRHAGTSFRPMYLQIPLLLSARLPVGRQMLLRPFAGGWYGVGIGGKARTADGWADLFGAAGFLRRSDAGLRAGVELAWRRICLGIGCDLGLCNLLRQQGETPLLPAGIANLQSRSLSIRIGYDF